MLGYQFGRTKESFTAVSRSLMRHCWPADGSRRLRLDVGEPQGSTTRSFATAEAVPRNERQARTAANRRKLDAEVARILD